MSDARAIIAIYFLDMIEEVERLYAQTNLFWGCQEDVLRTDSRTDTEVYVSKLGKVGSTVDEVSKLVLSLKNKIIDQAKLTKNKLPPDQLFKTFAR